MIAVTIVFWVIILGEFALVAAYVYATQLRGGASKAEAGREAAGFVFWVALAGGVLFALGHYCQYDIRTLEPSQYPLFALGLVVTLLGIARAFKIVSNASRKGGLK